MSIGCTLAGGVANKITAKWALVIGAAFYTPYAAGLYCNNRYGNQWFMLLGAGFCGVGASLLWASEAAIAVGYPEQAKRGKYVGIWMAIRQCGPLIGGSISLALNIDTDHQGKVSYNTYLGLIAISALGAPCALLLSQPGKVIRSDGTRVPHMRKTSIAIEARGIWRQIKSPYLLLLIPVFLAGQFGVTYQSNYLTSTSARLSFSQAACIARLSDTGLLTDYFTVRARALASFLTAIVGFLANIGTGAVLDLNYPQATKSRAVYLTVAFFITACWIWNAVVESELSHLASSPSFDMGQAGSSASALAVYMMFRFWYEVLQTYLYWLMGEIKGEGSQDQGGVARTTGILRSWESIGSTVAYAVGATAVSNMNQMILGFVLWGVTVPFTLWAIYGDWAPIETKEFGPSEDSGASVSGLEIEGQRVVVDSDAKY